MIRIGLDQQKKIDKLLSIFYPSLFPRSFISMYDRRTQPENIDLQKVWYLTLPPETHAVYFSEADLPTFKNRIVVDMDQNIPGKEFILQKMVKFKENGIIDPSSIVSFSERFIIIPIDITKQTTPSVVVGDRTSTRNEIGFTSNTPRRNAGEALSIKAKEFFAGIRSPLDCRVEELNFTFPSSSVTYYIQGELADNPCLDCYKDLTPDTCGVYDKITGVNYICSINRLAIERAAAYEEHRNKIENRHGGTRNGQPSRSTIAAE